MVFVDVPETHEEPLSSILSSLRLERHGEGRFTGSNLYQISGRVYGGQVFAQAVIAAACSCNDRLNGRQIHSISSAFLRPGKLDVPTHFEVEEMLDGRSFSSRVVNAFQEDKMIFTARASFQKIQDGVEHASVQPDAPDPDSLKSSVAFFTEFDHPAARAMSSTNAVDLRHVSEPIWVKPVPPTEEPTLIWFRLRNHLPEGSTQTLHRALLAYASDQFMLEPVMRRHGMWWTSKDISLATLDHSIWWHRDINMEDWILADLRSPSAQAGRGLSVAKYFQNGVHVATMAQEGMTRVRR